MWWFAVSVALSVGAFAVTSSLVPRIKVLTLRAGLGGKDLCKKGTAMEDKLVPEALGIVPGTVYVVALILCQLFHARTPDRLAEYNAALLSVCFMLLLGFADDVLDLRWRYKLVLPFVAALPLAVTYWVHGGVTAIIVPRPFRDWLVADRTRTWLGSALNLLVTVDEEAHGAVLELGVFYLLYMVLLAVFCTNAINIYAGVNGIEAGQALVVACALLTMNLYEATFGAWEGTAHTHLLSAMLVAPFIGTNLGLLRYNWYPASVFVGDTYCYFAGMTFAVVAATGHFSKSLLLFLIPQLLNFLVSIPQLLPKRFPAWARVPCPRHRLPRFDPPTGLMHASHVPASLDAREPMNLTLINLCLRLLGPMREDHLVLVLLAFQAACCALGLAVRYNAACLFYDCSA